MTPLNTPFIYETRRQFFSRTVARARRGRAGDDVRPRCRLSAAGPAPDKYLGGLPNASALRAEGEARRVHAHARRPSAAGSVRLQARTQGLVRQGSARFRAPGTAADDDVVGAGEVSDRAVDLQVLAARPERRLGIGAAAAYREDGGRHRDREVALHRADQSRAGDYLHSDRFHDRRKAVHRIVAGVWPRQHVRGSPDVRRDERGALAICGRRFRRCRRACGAPDFFRRSTPACRCARAPSRCCSSTIPTACRRLSAGGCSMR